MEKNISSQTIELTSAIPQVVLYRIIRMLELDGQSSQEDLLEMNRMWAEKVLAATESYEEIMREILVYQQKVLASATTFWFAPWLMPAAMVESSVRHAPRAGERMLSKGLAPIHGRAVANAERLNRASVEGK